MSDRSGILLYIILNAKYMFYRVTPVLGKQLKKRGTLQEYRRKTHTMDSQTQNNSSIVPHCCQMWGSNEKCHMQAKESSDFGLFRSQLKLILKNLMFKICS